MKLLGYPIYQVLRQVVGLPNILIFYGHMHDFFPTEDLQTLPKMVRFAFSRNKDKGLEYTHRFFKSLQAENYQFVTMSELAQKLKRA